MAAREELERLAEECEVCALDADESLDDHMISCPVCSDHVTKAEEIDRMVQEMAQLAKEPEEMRQGFVYGSVAEILGMPEEKREEAMRDMFYNITDLNTAQQTHMIKTRTDVITSLPKPERDKVLHSARHIYASFDVDRRIREEQAIITATQAYNPLKRTLVRRMYRNLMR